MNNGTEATVIRQLMSQRSKARGKRLTQTEVATGAGLPLSTLAALLSNDAKGAPRDKTVLRVAEFFAVKPDVIRGKLPVPELVNGDAAPPAVSSDPPRKRPRKHSARKKKNTPEIHAPGLDDLRDHFKAYEHLCVGLSGTRDVREYVALLARMLFNQSKAALK